MPWLAWVAVVLAIAPVLAWISPILAYVSIAAGILVIPLYAGWPKLRRTWRELSFVYVRVRPVVSISLGMLIVLSVRFLYNLSRHGRFMGPEVFMNVLILNLILVAVLGALLLRDHRGVRDPAHMIIRHRGDSDSLYLWGLGRLRHIPNVATFGALGLAARDVVTISDDEFKAYPQGERLPPVEDIVLARGERWVVMGDEVRRIPDSVTTAVLSSQSGIGIHDSEWKEKWRRGADVPSVAGFR